VEVRGAFPTLREARDQLIDLALERSGGRQAMAARLLGISAAALSKELKKRGERSAGQQPPASRQSPADHQRERGGHGASG
jgi:predicted transcriptional regulator